MVFFKTACTALVAVASSLYGSPALLA